jgi:hypothetical protein
MISLTVRLAEIEPAPRMTTLSTATVHVDVENSGKSPVTIDHETHRIMIEVRRANGELLLTIDEGLRGRMLFERTGAQARKPLILQPRQASRISFRLCEYYYPFAMGRYKLNAAFSSRDDATVRIEGEAEIEVSSVPVASVIEWYENPIFGNRSLLCRAAGDGEKGAPLTVLRWLGADKPCGSFDCRILEGLAEGGGLFPVMPAFWQMEDMEAGVTKVFAQDLGQGKVRLSRYFSGGLEGEPKDLQLPTGLRVLPHAFRTENDTVFLFGVFGEGSMARVRGFAISSAGETRPCLEHAPTNGARIVIQGGPDVIRFFEAGSALKQIIFDHRGTKVREQTLFEHRRRASPLYLHASLALQSVRAAFVDPDDSRRLTLVAAKMPLLDEKTELQVRELKVPLGQGARITDIDFAIDSTLGVPVLYTTSRGNLLYRGPEGRVHRLAKSTDAFFPRIVLCKRETRKVMLGFFRRQFGYRFVPAADGDVRAALDMARI